MAGLFDSILDRSRPTWQPTPDAAFPELKPEPPAEDTSWLSSIPQTLLPPHLRKKAAALPGVDASNPSIAAALARQPGTGAGMITGVDQPAFLTPTERALQADAGAPPAPAVPLPMARPAAADAAPDPLTTDISGGMQGASPALPGATDVSSQSRGPLAIAPQAAAAPPVAAPPASSPFELPSILNKIRTTLGDNSNTLLALGAGFAGAPTIGQGISRAAAAAIPARAADIKQQLDLQSRAYGTKALIDAGVPAQQAIAAQGDPELKKALIQSYITDRGKDIKLIKTKDAWGNETEVPYVMNKFPKDGEPVLTPAFGGAGASGAAALPPGSPPPTQTFAPGITAQNFDHTKVGEDYINQYSPEVQASAKAYLAGRSLPTGRQIPIQLIKMAATKYGDDIGMPADDASISQRKQWSNSLGDVKSGVGLASKGFKQGLEHFVKLSDNLVKMNLSNGLGIEPVAGLINSAKNLTTDQQELVHKSDVIGQALAREMGNLFSKNGGGVHEAAETKKNVSNATMSSKAAAGSLEAIDELMQGGLRTLEQRRDELFPNGNAPKGSQFLGPEQEKALERIRSNIAMLKGEKRPAEAAAGAAGPVLVPGKAYKMLPDGTLVPK